MRTATTTAAMQAAGSKSMLIVETDIEPVQFSDASDTQQDTQRANRMLWYALVALNVARPAGADHQQIAAVLATVERGIGAEETKAVADILQELGLANTTADRAGRPHTVITSAGIDVVEYRSQAPKGIGRPR